MSKRIVRITLSIAALAILSGCDAIIDAITKTHESETISIATLWEGTHVVKGTLRVNAPLTIKACSTIKMDSGASIDVRDNGSITVIGKSSCTTKFTSYKTIPAPGDWDAIYIYGTASAGNAFEFVTFEYGGGTYGAIWMEDGAQARIDRSTFSHLKDKGVEIADGATLTSFVGNTFKSIGGNPVWTSVNIAPSLSPIVTSDITAAANRVHLFGIATESGTWKDLGIPYEVEGIHIHATVTVEPGTTITVVPSSIIEVSENGALIMEGTPLERIAVISAKTTPKAGDWDYIGIYNTSSEDNRFAYVDFKHGGSTYGIFWVEHGATVSFDDCTFSEIEGPGMEMKDVSLGSFTGNAFSDISGYPIITSPDVVPSLSPITVADIATDKDRIHVTGGDAEIGGTWKNLGIPYELDGININAPVVVEAGTTLLITPNEILDIANNGSLILEGTADAHITVKSSKTSPAAGDWDYIGIYNTSGSDNRFTYADIMHGGSGNYGQIWIEYGATLALEHTTFTDGDTCDIDADEDAILTVTDSTYIACPE